MPDNIEIEKLHPALRWWPRPPWTPDPGPEWIQAVVGSDPAVAKRLATVQLQLVKDTLTAQMKAVDALQQVVGVR